MDDTTLRDYFAAHAPQEVPGGFKHTPPPGEPKQPPSYEDTHPRPNGHEIEVTQGYAAAVAAEHAYADAANRWHKEQLGAWTKYENELLAWNQADRLARLTQWAYAYADAMLEARRK